MNTKIDRILFTVTCIFLVGLLLTMAINHDLQQKKLSRQINDELYLLETTLFGDGNEPRPEMESYPGRIRACQLRVSECE